MTCIVRRSGTVAPAKATVTLTRGSTTVVIRDTPAEVCAECGEYYLSEDVTRAVLLIEQRKPRLAARDHRFEHFLHPNGNGRPAIILTHPLLRAPGNVASLVV